MNRLYETFGIISTALTCIALIIGMTCAVIIVSLKAMRALQSEFSSTGKNKRHSLKLFCALIAVACVAGCAKPPRSKLQFTPKSITRVTYDPSRCKDMPGGKVICDGVIFTLATVEVQKEK